MNPFATRVHADELAGLLDDDQGLPAGPSAAAAYRLVEHLRRAGDSLGPLAAPDPDFRAALRQRLVAVASVADPAVQDRPALLEPLAAAPVAPVAPLGSLAAARARRERRSLGPRGVRRGLGVAAGALAGAVAISGVAAASSRSLPGDPFYGVKRAGEGMQLRLADGDVEKGIRYLQLASVRLAEVRDLAAQGDPADSRVDGTFALMDLETRTGSDLLSSTWRDTGQTAPLRRLASWADVQSGDLLPLFALLPPGVVSRARTSLALVSGLGLRATAQLSLGTCTAGCLPPTGGPAGSPAQPGSAQPAATAPGAGPAAPGRSQAPDPASTAGTGPADGAGAPARARQSPGPGSQVPGGQVPAGQVPAGQVPGSQVPAGQVPGSQVPAGQVPAGQVPGLFPGGQLPGGQVPGLFPGTGSGSGALIDPGRPAPTPGLPGQQVPRPTVLLPLPAPLPSVLTGPVAPRPPDRLPG